MKGFSSKTEVNSVFKLSDLIKTLKLNKEEKDEAKNIQSIILTHIFNADTTGLKATDSVPLIYVFKVKLNTCEVPNKFITALDKKTNALTVIEVENGDTFTYIMSNKRLGDNIVVGEYFSTLSEEWTKEDILFDTLQKLYIYFLSKVLGLTARQNETQAELVERKKNIQSIEATISKLERQKANEVQFNKRVKINDEIRELMKEEEKLR